MSFKGICKFAKVLSNLQTVRGELLGMNTKQDIRLGQMLDDMKKLVVDKFIKETLNIDEKKVIGG